MIFDKDLDTLIGKSAKEAKTLLAENKDIIRVIRYGHPITMDYNQHRLNLYLDKTHKIEEITRG